MSSKASFSFTTSASFSLSSSSGGQSTGTHRTHQSVTNPSGTTIKTSSRNNGEPVYEETRKYDSQGRELLEGTGASCSTQHRIEDVTDTEPDSERR